MTDAPTVCANLPFILINEWKNKHVYYLSILIYFTNPDYYQSWLVARFMWPQNSFHFASVNFINTAVLLDHIHIWLLLCFNQYILVPQQTVFTVLGLLPSPCTNHTHKFQPNCCAEISPDSGILCTDMKFFFQSSQFYIEEMILKSFYNL